MPDREEILERFRTALRNMRGEEKGSYEWCYWKGRAVSLESALIGYHGCSPEEVERAKDETENEKRLASAPPASKQKNLIAPLS